MSQIRDTIASMPSVACRKTGTGLLEPARPHTVRQRAGTRIGTSGRALTGGHTGSLPGCDTGLVLRLAETGRQLRLKAASFADFAAWLVALHAVPGMREAEFTSLSLELQAAAATANDERDASRSRALAQGLAGLSGAMRDAVQPVASAAAEMAEAQHELRQSLASLHEHYSALTAEMAMARHVALQERNAFLPVLRAGGSGHAPSGHAIHAHSQPAREPRGGQHQDASAAQPLQPSGLFPSKTRQQRGGTCAEDGAPSRRARVPPPAEEEPKALVEGDEECEAQGETRLSNFAPLGALDQGRSGLRGIAGDVSPGRLRSCIAAVQAQFAYSKTHMPTMAHMRQAGFAAEALSVTYAFGGRAALAARLGLEGRRGEGCVACGQGSGSARAAAAHCPPPGWGQEQAHPRDAARRPDRGWRVRARGCTGRRAAGGLYAAASVHAFRHRAASARHGTGASFSTTFIHSPSTFLRLKLDCTRACDFYAFSQSP